jgi:hypothetical protein
MKKNPKTKCDWGSQIWRRERERIIHGKIKVEKYDALANCYSRLDL